MSPLHRRARSDATPPTGRTGWLRTLATVLLAVGVLLVAEAVVTVLWQEPVTHVLARHEQARLADQLRSLRPRRPDPDERRAVVGLGDGRRRIAAMARALGRSAAPGSAVGELTLPRIGRYVVAKGTDPSALRKGPGTYTGVGLPGVPGTAAIAGHRTTYGAPFRHLDRLRGGDRILVDMPYARLTYRVERTRIVKPDDLSVLTRRSYDRLVLSACHPLYSADERIVVLARLEREQPPVPR